ncbi:MAG: PspA/IM30 family protein [bacterium]
MAKQNPLIRLWKYLTAWSNNQIDEKADPKIQIQQAITEAQREHEALSRQAASVIGNQRQLEMKLDRQLGTVENLKAQARQSLVLADKARTEGDVAKSTDFENTAQSLATQLVNAEASVEDLKQLHDQALSAAEQARQAVSNNAMMLEQRLAERTKLLSQLEQAKMQEQVSASLNQISEMAAPGNTPTLDEVRDKIERRYANALGQADLASNSVQGRMLEVQRATQDMAGASRLEEIRASMHPELSAGGNGASAPAAIEDGAGADVTGLPAGVGEEQIQSATPPAERA